MIEHSTAGKNRANPKSGFCLRWTQQLLIASLLGIILSAGSLSGDVRDADGNPAFFAQGKRMMTRYEVEVTSTGYATDDSDTKSVLEIYPCQTWEIQGDDILQYEREAESHSVILTRDGVAWGDDAEYCDWVGRKWRDHPDGFVENMVHRPFGKIGESRGRSRGVMLMDHVSRAYSSAHRSSLLLRSDASLWLVSSLVAGAQDEGLYWVASNVVEAFGGVEHGEDPTRNWVCYLNSNGEVWLDTIRGLPDTKIAENVVAIGHEQSLSALFPRSSSEKCYPKYILAILSSGEVRSFSCEVSEDFQVSINESSWFDLKDFALGSGDAGFLSGSGYLVINGELALVTADDGYRTIEGSGGVVQCATIIEQIENYHLVGRYRTARYGRIYLTEDGTVRYLDEYFDNARSVIVAHGVQQLSDGSILRDYSGVPIYRFSNTETGAHFFCLSRSEAAGVFNMEDWEWEGFSFGVPMESDEGSQPVYRMYNKASGAHFYTMSVEERDNLLATRGDTFQLEGVAFHAFGHQAEGTLPVYRFFAPKTQSHFFTISEEEKDWIVANVSVNDLVLDGIAWYCWPW